MPFAWFLSFSMGFLSLSQEILWVRLVGFGHMGRPQAFSIVLAAFLAGIAIGAIVGRRVCEKSHALLDSAGKVLVVAGLVDLLTLYLLPFVLLDTPRRLSVMVTLIAANSALKGVLFPIVHHLGTKADTGVIGRSVSHVYICNVLGATLGPIVTGFFLLDRFDVEIIFASIGLITLTLGLVSLWTSRTRSAASWSTALAAGIVAIALATNPPEVIRAVARGYDPDLVIPHVVQNKHGIVHMARSAEGGDITYGGNVYDGRINVDMRVNSNQLDRAYLLGILHPNPRRVLVVGLSTGAWTKVILGIPGVEVVDVVEINPAYLDLIRLYPEVASILADPRVNIHIDDGRRWLRAKPQERYDLVFQNTTWHWRAYTSMLLSVDYFRQLQGHLNKNGIIAVNTTGSADVFRTAAEVFPHVARYRKFAYMSDAPLLRRSDAESLLRKLLIDQEPAFPDELFAPDRIGHHLLTTPLESAEQLLSNTRAGDMARIITDQNLLTEFRHGRRPLYGWLDGILPPAPGEQDARSRPEQPKGLPPADSPGG